MESERPVRRTRSPKSAAAVAGEVAPAVVAPPNVAPPNVAAADEPPPQAPAPGRRLPLPEGPGRSILLIGAALAALVIVSVVTVVAAGGRGVQTYPADSPEGALQRYLRAIEDGDYEDAYTYFSSEVQAVFPEREFADAGGSPGRFDGNTERTVRVERVDVRDDEATVHLSVEEYLDTGFGSSEYGYQRSVRLVRDEGAWKIDEPLYGLEPGPPPFEDPFFED